jgi:hypothetical protein
MTVQRTHLKLGAMLMLAVAALSIGLAAQKKDTSAANAAAANLPELIWRDPGSMSALDLRYGTGGKAHAPDLAGTFTFVSEDPLATNPKFNVTDNAGVEWKVKLGAESQSETAATRFLWAAGFYADEDYYVAELTVQGLPTLRRGQTLVSAGGIVHGARLERKPTAVEKLGDWDWFDNPFVGRRELNGLRVMMALLNNWDLKAVNNTIYAVDGERRYTVTDVGAAFGRTGRAGTQSKGVPKDYQDSRFVAKSTADSVDFVFHSRPMFLLWMFAPSYYGERTRMEKITKHIPRADAKWVGDRLALLTEFQIREAFRSAGYGADDVESLTATIRRRIAVLEAL